MRGSLKKTIPASGGIISYHYRESCSSNNIYIERELTRKVPRLGLVEVDMGDGGRGEMGVQHLFQKVMGDQLFVGRVEAETRWEEPVGALVSAAAAAVIHGG